MPDANAPAAAAAAPVYATVLTSEADGAHYVPTDFGEAAYRSSFMPKEAVRLFTYFYCSFLCLVFLFFS